MRTNLAAIRKFLTAEDADTTHIQGARSLPPSAHFRGWHKQRARSHGLPRQVREITINVLFWQRAIRAIAANCYGSPLRKLFCLRLFRIVVASPFLAGRATGFAYSIIRGFFGLVFARFVILLPGAPLHVFFPCSNARMAVMLFHFVFVIFYNGAPQ